jgi:cytochrome c
MTVAAAIIAAGALAVFMIVRRGISARDEPTWLESLLARNMRRLAIPTKAKAARNPFSPTPQVLLEGRRHFADHCSVCHANDGSGKTAVGQNLYPKSPDLRLSATQELTDGELYTIIHEGIRLTGMPAWGDAGHDEDSWKLVLFVRHLRRITPEELRDMENFNPKSRAEIEEEKQEEEFLKSDDKSERRK